MKFILSLMILLVSVQLVTSQNDTIKVKNGNVIYGEIKKLRSSVITIETPYSDSDFQVEFPQVTEIHIQRLCFIVLTGGVRRTGHIKSEEPNQFTLTLQDGTKEVYPLSSLVVLDELKDSFWKRIKGNIDLSYNLTKANNARQLTLGGGLSYRGPKWNASATFTSLRSNQDNVDEIQRTDANANVQRVLPRNWYLLATYSFLSNTEQALNARNSIRPGAGRFLVLSNRLSWGLNAGLNFNFESFTDATPDRNSTELYIGSEFDMFDFKDWSLLTNINVFPSLSESGRWRIDYNLDIKWDLPLDFYIKTNFQVNYDNRPAAAGSDLDYIWTTGVGWEFN